MRLQLETCVSPYCRSAHVQSPCFILYVNALKILKCAWSFKTWRYYTDIKYCLFFIFSMYFKICIIYLYIWNVCQEQIIVIILAVIKGKVTFLCMFHHFLHKKMPVPNLEYDSCYLFVWCVRAFDFVIWLGTFRFDFPWSSVFLWFYYFFHIYTMIFLLTLT